MAPRHTVYSVGYQKFPYEALFAFVVEHPAILADLRLMPVSRFKPIWNKKRLAAALGPQYQWVEELGNLNYKGGPTLLKDPEAGFAKLRAFLEESDIVVMCVCSDVTTCHRTDVTNVLAAEGYPIEHLQPPAQSVTTLLFSWLF